MFYFLFLAPDGSKKALREGRAFGTSVLISC